MEQEKWIASHYEIGKVLRVTPIAAGLIHKTYAIKTNTGEYIIQRLHPLLASQKVGKDVLAVTRHLRANGFPSPECVLTRTGRVHARRGKDVWRMQTKLPGKTVDRITSPALAFKAGEMYARFHRVMDGIAHRFGSDLVLHETPKVYAKFLSVMKKNRRSPLMREVQDEVAFLTRELKAHLLPANLPRRVIHGDPKISNILFVRGNASAIIDLDTCNRHTILVEVGDALRSWCGKREDDPRNTFSLPLFRAAWKGYQKGAAGWLTKREIALVPKAIGTITLELAARFLTDAFEDSYFGWDSTRYESRRAHNLARCRGQLAQFRDYKQKLGKIQRILNA